MPQAATDGGAAAGLDPDLKESLQVWFTEKGVPRLGPAYSARDRVPVLFVLLLVLLAFQVGVAPWLPLTPMDLLLIPAALILVTLLFVGFWRMGVKEDASTVRFLVYALILAAVAAGTSALLQELTPLPPLDSEPWMEAGTVLLAGAAATFLWSTPWEDLDRLPRALVPLVLVVAIVAFALEDSAIELFGPEPAVFVAAGIFLLSLVVWAGARERPSSTRCSEALATSLAVGTAVAAFLFGAEETVVRHAAGEGALQGVLPLAALALLLLVITLWTRHNARRPPLPTDRVRDLADNGRFQAAYVAVFVLSYPSIVAFFSHIEIGGDPVTGLAGFGVAAGVNLFYFALVVWVIVGLGLDRVASWAARELIAHRSVILVGLVRGLPLLLGIAGISLLTAELWQSVSRVGRDDFFFVLGILGGLSLAFVVTTAWQEVKNLSEFDRWEDVADSAKLRGDDDEVEDDSAVGKVVQRLSSLCDGAASVGRHPLRGREWLNSFAVLIVYQALLFVPVALGTLLLFWQLGERVVPPGVAAEWVFGDGTPASEGHKLRARDGVDDPWLRVTLVLSAFSVLYYAIQVMSNRDEYFFKGADRTLKQRFAARAAYKELERHADDAVVADAAPPAAPEQPDAPGPMGERSRPLEPAPS